MMSLALAAALQAAAAVPSEQTVATPPPVYPLVLSSPREFAEVGPAKLIDLSYSLEDGLSALHTFSAGVQFGGRAIARAWFKGDDRFVALETARLDASFGQIGGELQGGLAYTAARSRLDARTIFHPSESGDGGATVSAGWLRELRDDLDLKVRVSGETKSVRFPAEDRTQRAGLLRVFYQRSEKFEAELEGERRRVHTPGDLEFDETASRLRAAGTVRRGAYDLEARYVDRDGKYSVRNASFTVNAALPLSERLLFETADDVRHEIGGGVREYRASGAVSWFARRIRLARTGAAAKRAIDLARAAREDGYFERAGFDSLRETSHRDLRRRAALRGAVAARTAALARDLHEAEIDDRGVPLFGVSYEVTSRNLTGESSRSMGLNVSTPWPARFGFGRQDDATRFLRLDLLRRRTAYGVGLVGITKSAGLTLELNRELSLGASLTHADPTPIERVRGIGSYRIFSVGFDYAYGR